MIKGKFNFFKLFIIILSFFIFINLVNSIDISTCSDLNSTGSTYYLTSDILNSSINNCINISANNVIFDCQSHLIEGNKSSYNGIKVENVNNITIRNCKVQYWNGSALDSASIYVNNSSNNMIYNINSSSSGYRGLLLYNSNNNSIYNNIFHNNSNTGIYFRNSNNNTVYDLIAYNNTQGIYFMFSENNIIHDLTAYNNYNTGVAIQSSGNNNVFNIVSYNNVLYGIYNQGSYESNYTNFLTYNNSYGLYQNVCDYNNFNNFNSYDNSYGIFVSMSTNNNYSNFNVYNNTKGFEIFWFSEDNKITNSTIRDNHEYNLYFWATSDYPKNNIFYNNYLGNSSKFYSNFAFNATYGINYFNYLGVGNRWDDMPICINTVIINGEMICTNPANYTINVTLGIYDIAPIDYRYSAVIQSASMNSIFPLVSDTSAFISFVIILSYFLLG